MFIDLCCLCFLYVLILKRAKTKNLFMSKNNYNKSIDTMTFELPKTKEDNDYLFNETLRKTDAKFKQLESSKGFHVLALTSADLYANDEVLITLKKDYNKTKGCYLWIYDDTAITIGHSLADIIGETRRQLYQYRLNRKTGLGEFWRRTGVEWAVLYIFIPGLQNTDLFAFERELIEHFQPIYRKPQKKPASVKVKAPKRPHMQPIKITDTRTGQTFTFESISAAVRSSLDIGSRPTVRKYLKTGALYKETWLLEPINQAVEIPNATQIL